MSIRDFTILAKLGQGAYSTVYKVERLADGLQYALKKVKLNNLSDKQAENALNEVRILASISHPNIVSYKEAFLEGKSLCIVMQFANDGDLYHKISENKKKKQYFDEGYIWKTVIHILRGLKQLHDLKIFHRDIKTANVFLNSGGHAQLGDMNVSKIAQNGLLYTQTGTPYYASPEVWSEQPYDSKSDIWSLGCVIYEMTALEVPFKAEDMEGLANCVLAGHFDPVPNIFSKELSILISNMLQLKPKNRPTCQKMLKYPITLKKIEELQLNVEVGTQNQREQLLRTIRMPKRLQYLTDSLPKSNYSFSQSHANESLPLKRKKEERQRTNTLPKIERMGRYPEQAKQYRRKRSNHSIIRSSLLCVQGVSKNINDVKLHVEMPDRRDKLQREINRIYQGRHPVHHSNDPRGNQLPGIRR